MALGVAVRNKRKDRAKVEFHRPKTTADCSSMPKKLKGERAYSSLMNLAVSR